MWYISINGYPQAFEAETFKELINNVKDYYAKQVKEDPYYNCNIDWFTAVYKENDDSIYELSMHRVQKLIDSLDSWFREIREDTLYYNV